MLAVFYKFKDTRYGRVVLLAFFLIAMTPFVSHYYLSRRSTSEFDFYVTSFHTRSALEDNDRSLYRIDELKRNVDELERVKLSLKNELRELEGKRHSLLREIQEYSNNVEEIRTKATRLRVEVQRRQQELEDLRLVKKEMNDCPQLPFLKPSKDLLPRLSTNFETYPRTTFQQTTDCSLSSCFNFQKCSFLDDFTAHVYNPDKLVINLSSKNKVAREVYYLLKSMPYSNDVSKPISCIYVVIIGPFSGNMSITAKELENSIYKLPFWQGDGHNHILMNFAGDQIFKGVNIGRAMLAQTSFGTPIQYRQNFDILIPPLESLLKTGPAWAYSEPQLPARRKYLLSFEGNHEHLTKTSRKTGFVSNEDLKQLSSEAKDLHIQLNCQVDEIFSKKIGWQVCGTHASRASVLKKSTYTLILQSEHTNDQTMSIMRFIEALQYGAIPVVLKDNIILPFQDMINWQQASVMLYNAQLPQVHFILRTISVNDLLEMRRQGRFLWETYLSTTEAVLATILGTMRTWLSLPAKSFKGINFPSAFSEENKPIFNSLLNSDSIVEHPMRSPTFFRNFTLNNVFARHTWNTYPGALVSFPSEPFVPVLPSSTAFHNSSTGFQPIGKGAGGAGVEFQKALGGDYPIEQFTIVMLTYERELVLMEALGRLAGLQHLNKVIVVWNSPQDPSADLKWPSIGVPIHVLQPQKNSLNNRFLPHDQIETDAILSMDDDAHLRQDEISFGFRVWREARDRIVGFPGRFHSWDLNYGGWLYNSNYSCELSMVLTGAAFFHKYYAYLYSYVMPEAIRNKVDEYTNCEDIAMNFLVSHVTRKPPIKVTSRWTFRCPGCPQTLSQDETHFNERHNCINFFVKVYGYMPLLRTQFRADSVLFKTRLPHDKTKCYTYI